MLGILLIFKCRTLKNFLHELGTQNWKNNSDLVDLGTRDLVKSVAWRRCIHTSTQESLDKESLRSTTFSSGTLPRSMSQGEITLVLEFNFRSHLYEKCTLNRLYRAIHQVNTDLFLSLNCEPCLTIFLFKRNQ